MKPLYLFIFLFCAAAVSAQPPGTLDKTFGRKGRQWDTVGRYAAYPAMLVQPDGKIIVGGSGFLPGSGIKTFRIDRLLGNGTPDNTFGVNGTVLVTFHLSGNEQTHAAAITSMALLPDGKILAAGVYGKGGGYTGDLTIVRFLPGGSIDTSFGDSGIAQLKVKGGFAKAIAMQVQADGKIVLGGNFERNYGGLQACFLQRLLPGGSPDAGFATGGQIIDSIGSINAIAIQPDGKIVAGGEKDSLYSIPHFLIRRYLINGTPDAGFGKNGATDTIIGANVSYVTDLALQPDGSIIAAGASGKPDGTYPYFTLTRFSARGAIDKAFGSKGAVISSYISYSPKVLLYSNKILLAGNKLGGTPDNTPNVVVNAYNTNGSIDSSFATKGTLTVNYDVTDIIGSAALQPDGKIVLLDLSRDYEQTYEVRNLLRYYGYPAPLLISHSEKNGISSLSAIASSVHIYPNPAKEYVVVTGLQSGTSATITITDGLGKIIATYNTAHAAQYRCNVSQLTPGVYYVQVQANDKTNLLKLIKE